MRIEFLKMHGLGNDFMVFDATAHVWYEFLDSARLRALADRHTGVGFNQALILEAPKNPRSRIFYRVFNSDGSEVEQCGNGARCVAALMFARDPELGRDLEKIDEVRKVWQFYRDRRPETYADLTKI